MKIIVNSYPVAFQCPGGGEIQLLKSIEALERKGITVVKFDPWTTKLADADVVHYFSVQGGSMNFCSYVENISAPLVISPIIWLGDDPQIYPVNEISQLLQISDIICPNSIAEAQQLASYFDIPREKFVVTHNGIDAIFFTKVDGALFREKYEIAEPFILCVANIEPRKNQANLIEAAKTLNQKLVLVGNIRDKAYYDHCMRTADGNIQYLGYINHDDHVLRSAYHACEVFALPSMLETPGLAALEAAACNAKIVITEIGATREYFGDLATYVCPTDPLSIREGLLKAIAAPHPPMAHLFEKYSWDNTADELINAYEKAMALHGT